MRMNVIRIAVSAEHLGKWQTRKVATVQRRMVELERLVLSVTDWDCFTWLA